MLCIVQQKKEGKVQVNCIVILWSPLLYETVGFGGYREGEMFLFTLTSKRFSDTLEAAAQGRKKEGSSTDLYYSDSP